MVKFFLLDSNPVCLLLKFGILQFSSYSLFYGDRFISFLLIGFMLPILVGMKNLVLLLITKPEIYGSSFYPPDVFCLLVVKYAFFVPLLVFYHENLKIPRISGNSMSYCHGNYQNLFGVSNSSKNMFMLLLRPYFVDVF